MDFYSSLFRKKPADKRISLHIIGAYAYAGNLAAYNKSASDIGSGALCIFYGYFITIEVVQCCARQDQNFG